MLNIVMIGLANTKMYKNGLSIEQIAFATDKTVEEVKTIIEGKDN